MGTHAINRQCRPAVRRTTRAAALLTPLLAVFVGCGRTPTPTTPPDRAVVVEVIDGDTVRLQLGDAREDVRLIGIDTPETKHPTKPVECFGPEASAFLARLLPVGATLRVERDMEGRDSYRRLLLYLFLPTSEGERFVNLELVARGFATPLAIEPNTRYQQHFVAAAFDAQQHSRGLWGACK
ncbi:MAG: thermonuclease family protein [Actinomycetota bacterium]